MSLRTLLRASALYTVGNVAPKLGAFLLLPIYLRFLSPEEYGALALLTSLAGILAVVYHLGADSALMRLHFDTSGRSRGQLYSTLTIFSGVTAATMTVILSVTLGPFFETVFAGTPFLPLGLIALLLAATGSLQYIPSTLFRATGQAGRFLALNVGAFLASSAMSIALVVAFRLGPAGVLTGQLIANAAVVVVAMFVVSRMGEWSFQMSSLKPALRLGLPLLPHAVSAWAMRLADRWLIALLIGLPALDARAQVGIYAVGYQLGYVVGIAITSFNAAWSPYFFRVGSRPAGPRLYTHMTTVVIGGFLALAVGVSALAPEIVAVIARPGYAQAADVLPVIAFASVFQGLYVMFVTVVFLVKRTSRLAAITLTAAAVNVGVNIILIPPLGIMGAAWSTLAAYAFFAAATYAMARRMYPMRIDWLRIGAMALAASAAVLAARATTTTPSVAAGLVHAAIALAFVLVAAAICLPAISSLRDASRELPDDTRPT